MKNSLSNNCSVETKHSRIIRVVGIVILTTFFLGSWSISFGQDVCDQYEEYFRIPDQYSQGQVDTILLALAKENYWDEWYHLIYDYSYLVEKRSYHEAVKYMEDQEMKVEINDLYILGKFYYLLSYEYEMAGDLFNAIKDMKIAHGVFSRINDRKYVLWCYKSLSYFYSLFNDHFRAIEYGYLYLENMPIRNKEKLASGHYNMAEYFFHVQEFEKSLIHADSAVFYHDKYLPSKKLLDIKIALNLGNNSEAKKLIQACRQEFGYLEKVSDKLDLHEAQYLRGSNQYDKSIVKWKSILQKPVVETYEREQKKPYQWLAEDYYHIEEYQKALETTHELQKYFALEFDSEDPFSIPDSIQLIPEAWLMESLFLKAKIFEKLSLEDLDKDALVLSTYEKSMYVLDRLRIHYSAIGSIFNISEADYKIFDAAISYCRLRWEESGESSFYERALGYSQMAKSFVLRQSRSYRKFLNDLGVDVTLSKRYLELLAQQHENLKDKREVYDSLEYYIKRIAKEHPGFNSNLHQSSIGSQEIQDLLPASSALLHFFVGDSLIHCFSLTNQKKQWSTHVIPKDIDGIMSEYNQSLKDPEYVLEHHSKAEKEYLKSSNQLYELLIGKQKEFLDDQNINHIIVVPDDFINEVSFGALTSVPVGSWTDPEIFLLNRFNISQLYLMSDLTQEGFGSAATVHSSVSYGMDYSNYTTWDTTNFSILENGLIEAREVSEIIGAKFRGNERVVSDDIVNVLRNSELIHYSGHAVYDPQDYTQSYLPVYNAEQKGSPLSYGDIISTSSRVHFAGLSACNTTNGQEIRTEGLIGLSRALIESGVESCLGSLWNASDESSKRILTDFYKFLKQGYDKPEALNMAQSNYLKDTQMRKMQRIPLFWANWKMYGDPGPLEFNSSYPWKYILIALALPVIGIFFFRKLKKA